MMLSSSALTLVVCQCPNDVMVCPIVTTHRTNITVVSWRMRTTSPGWQTIICDELLLLVLFVLSLLFCITVITFLQLRSTIPVILWKCTIRGPGCQSVLNLSTRHWLRWSALLQDGGKSHSKFKIFRISTFRNFLVYIGFRIYRMNFAVRRDPIYPSSTV